MIDYLEQLLRGEDTFTVTLNFGEDNLWPDVPVRSVDATGIVVDYGSATHCVPWTSVKRLLVNSD